MGCGSWVEVYQCRAAGPEDRQPEETPQEEQCHAVRLGCPTLLLIPREQAALQRA